MSYQGLEKKYPAIRHPLVSEKKQSLCTVRAICYEYRRKGQSKVSRHEPGFSHPVEVIVPNDLEVSQESNTEITISGIDKQKVSEFVANIRKIREPEPYKGKGIRYKGEVVRRKEGKKAAK